MTRAELFLFLGNCLSIDYVPDNAAKARKIIASGSVSYEQLAALASSHFVTPAFYTTFTNSNITDSVPAGFIDYLREIHELNRERNSRIVSQVKEISTLLKASAIHPIFLKGAASIFDNLCSDTGDRIMADIDFLVNSNEFDACIEIMISAGYAPLDNLVNMAKHDKHYPRLFRKGEVAGVEVHRTPAGEKYRPWFNYDIISAEAGASLNDKEIIVPSDNHKTVLNFIHSQLSHKGHLYGFVSLRDAFDLMLIQRRIDRPLTDIPQPYKRKASAYFSLAAGQLGVHWYRVIRAGVYGRS